MPDDVYDPKAWRRIPEYGRFMLRQGDDWGTSFAPLFIDFMFSMKPGDAVLDVGCGAGTMAILVEHEHLPIRYTGLDITPCYLEMAKQRFPQHEWVEGDARQLPFGDRSFDYAFSVNLLTHLPRPDVTKVLQELTRVTKKAVFLQSEFSTEGSQHTRKSDFPNEDGSVTTFLYNYIGYDQLSLPGWEWRRVADTLRKVTRENWPAKYIHYDPGMIAYLVGTVAGRENQYIVLERKYNYSP